MLRSVAMRFAAGCLSFAAISAVALADDAATPSFASLEVFPERLDLVDVRDERCLLVTGITAEGDRYDLTREAQFVAAGPQVVVEHGFATPKAEGETTIKITAAGLETQIPVRVVSVASPPVDFIREIIPVTSKVGCNSGTCHGSQKGKAGFKLSLRGYDPLYDYRALVDDVSGRRFNRSMPSQSLMLLKPTQGVPHEGGFLFDENSRSYKLIHQWIAEGCKYEQTSRVARIEVHPEKPALQKADQEQQLVVLAVYDDGSTRDVTRDAVFETSNFEVATVASDGVVKAVRRGEAAAIVRYEGLYGVAQVTVIGAREGYQFADVPEANFVDTHVNAKLRQMKILPAELCSDAEFLRRVTLDLTGAPPTLEQTESFLADARPSSEKRLEKIDELLDSPAFVDHWTLKWSDLLLAHRKAVTEKGVWSFREWIRHAIATNMPFDKFTYSLMTASGSTFENPAANYYRIGREPGEITENMTQVFLGTRFNCNKCHDHPFERWTQTQYYQLSAYFSGVGRKGGGREGEEIIYSLRAAQPVVHPGTSEVVQASFPFTHEGQVESESDLRQQLAQWLVSKDNPYFARSITNRYWSYFFGRGIIEPVDDIRASNPPTIPDLLDALETDFVEHGFDVKRMIRTIVSSNTYQRSFKTNDWNKDDSINFSHALPRRLTAEQLYDAVTIASGAPTDLPGVPKGTRASQLPDPQIDVAFLDMFGRAPRESPCECERTSEVSLSQTLNLVNGPTVSDAIVHPQGLIARLIAANAPPEELIRKVYLSVLCREPSLEESTTAVGYFAAVSTPDEAAQDLMWALINSPAFLFNR